MLEVLIFETQLANISLSAEQRRDSSVLYNPMTVSQLSQLDPDTPWLQHFNKLLTADIVQVTGEEVVIVDVPSYIRNLASLLRVTPARVQVSHLSHAVDIVKLVLNCVHITNTDDEWD